MSDTDPLEQMADAILKNVELKADLANAVREVEDLVAERDAHQKIGAEAILRNARLDKINEGYRKLHVEQHQKLHKLEKAGNSVVASLSDVLIWHRDPESSDYNECEKIPCNFCELAGRGLDEWRAATGEEKIPNYRETIVWPEHERPGKPK